MDDLNEDEDLISPDVRRPQRLLDSRRQADGELSDSDDEGEDDRRDITSHREADSAPTGLAAPKRLAVGIMSTGSTHGIGPTVPQPVIPAALTAASGSSAQSDMDVDDDEAPLSQTVRARAKAKESDASTNANAMVIDSPTQPAAIPPAPVTKPQEQAQSSPATSTTVPTASSAAS